VTQSLAQRLGSEQKGGAENAGIALATAVMYLRVLVLIGVLATRVLLPFTVILLPAVAVAWGAGYLLYRKAPTCDAPAPPGNPIALLPAFGFVLFVAVAAIAAKWAAGRFGEQGIAVLLLIVGSTDVDTAIITLGNLHPDAISPLLAAMAIGPFLGFLQRFRHHLRRVEMAMGVVLVATGALVLTGSLNVMGVWLLENVPILGRIEELATPDRLQHEILQEGMRK